MLKRRTIPLSVALPVCPCGWGSYLEKNKHKKTCMEKSTAEACGCAKMEKIQAPLSSSGRAWRGMKSLCLPHCPPCWELVSQASQLSSAEELLDLPHQALGALEGGCGMSPSLCLLPTPRQPHRGPPEMEYRSPCHASCPRKPTYTGLGALEDLRLIWTHLNFAFSDPPSLPSCSGSFLKQLLFSPLIT